MPAGGGAQPQKKSEQFLDRKTASPKLGQAPGHVPFLLVANHPKRTCVKEDLKPANTISKGDVTAGWRCLGKGTPDLPRWQRVVAAEEPLSPRVHTGLSSSPTHGDPPLPVPVPTVPGIRNS